MLPASSPALQASKPWLMLHRCTNKTFICRLLRFQYICGKQLSSYSLMTEVFGLLSGRVVEENPVNIVSVCQKTWQEAYLNA